MVNIATILGPVGSSQLGVTLMHEHICFRFVGLLQTSGRHLDRAYYYNLGMLKQAREVGINTIVECTPWPNVELIASLNREVPEINIILSTGAYIDVDPPLEVRQLSGKEMEARMVKHVTEGFDTAKGTGIKAGIIKVASHWETSITSWEKQNLIAAAKAQKEGRVPIAVHAVSYAREMMKILKAAGANLHAVFFAHTEAKFGWEGRSREKQCFYLLDLLKEGIYLQFNNFGFEFDTPFSDLLYLINFIEEHRFGDHILLSVDTNIDVDKNGKIWHEAEKRFPETRQRNYAYAVKKVIPMLMESGVSLQRINKYFIDNPRRFFESVSYH